MRTSLVLLLFVAFNCRAGASKQPITFRYVKTGEFNNKGYISYGTVFWATNHTTNRFSLHLSAIENRVGTNWIVQSRQLEPLAFQGPGKPLAQYYLDPHSAGYATVQLSSAPIGTTW